MSRLSLAVAALLALPLAPAALAQGAVLVVGSGPGAFASVQAAVDAAADGDIIVVRAASSPEFSVAGKSLILVGDHDPLPQIGAAFAPVNEMGPDSQHSVVSDLGAGQAVVLRNLALRGLELRDVLGQVWLESCEVGGTAPALRASHCARLVVEGGLIEGPDAQPMDVVPGAGGRAVELLDTHALLQEVIALGGDGVDFHCNPFDVCVSSAGSDALSISGGSARIAGGSFVGGAGGDGGKDFFTVCTPGLPGGHGLSLLGGAPQVTLQQVSAVGGAGGAGGLPPCVAGSNFPGAHGLSVAVQSGGASIVPGLLDTLHASAPVTEGGLLSLFIQGIAGDGLLLLAGAQPTLVNVAALQGPLLVAPPLVLLPLGAVPPAGPFSALLPVPELGAGIAGLSVVLQLVAVPPAGPLRAGMGSVLVLLDGDA